MLSSSLYEYLYSIAMFKLYKYFFHFTHIIWWGVKASVKSKITLLCIIPFCHKTLIALLNNWHNIVLWLSFCNSSQHNKNGLECLDGSVRNFTTKIATYQSVGVYGFNYSNPNRFNSNNFLNLWNNFFINSTSVIFSKYALVRNFVTSIFFHKIFKYKICQLKKGISARH